MQPTSGIQFGNNLFTSDRDLLGAEGFNTLAIEGDIGPELKELNDSEKNELQAAAKKVGNITTVEQAWEQLEAFNQEINRLFHNSEKAPADAVYTPQHCYVISDKPVATANLCNCIFTVIRIPEQNTKLAIHIDMNTSPKSIKEAVIDYLETMKVPVHQRAQQALEVTFVGGRRDSRILFKKIFDSLEGFNITAKPSKLTMNTDYPKRTLTVCFHNDGTVKNQQKPFGALRRTALLALSLSLESQKESALVCVAKKIDDVSQFPDLSVEHSKIKALLQDLERAETDAWIQELNSSKFSKSFEGVSRIDELWGWNLTPLSILPTAKYCANSADLQKDRQVTVLQLPNAPRIVTKLDS